MNCMTFEEFEELRAGDFVTIRDYDEMIADGTLMPTPHNSPWISICEGGIRFNEEKRKMCGNEFKICEIDSRGLCVDIEGSSGNLWAFPIKCLESPSAAIVVDEQLFDSLLGELQ